MSDYIPHSPRPPSRPAARRRIWRTPINIVIVIVIGLALAALLTWCVSHRGGAGAGAGGGRGAHGGRGGRGGGGGGPGGRPAITVGVAKVALGDIPITVE